MASNTDVESIIHGALLRDGGGGGGTGFFDRIEQACVAIPGMRYPPIRMAVGAGITTAVVWAIRPSISFTPQGAAKPWVQLVAQGDEQDAQATNFPWYFFSLAGGLATGVFF